MNIAQMALNNAKREAGRLKEDLAEERLRCWQLTQALKFYADPDAWKTRGHPQIDAHDTPINRDQGATAREALALSAIESPSGGEK